MSLEVSGEVPAGELHLDMVVPSPVKCIISQQLGNSPPPQAGGHHRGEHLHGPRVGVEVPVPEVGRLVTRDGDTEHLLGLAVGHGHRV